jgi:hypothetical protein
VREALRQFAEEKANDKNPAQVKEFQEDLKKIVDTANDPNRPRVPARESEPGEIDLGAFEEESVGKFAEQAMKRAEETKLGDWLRDSPSWNRAFRDLRQSMNEPGKPNWQGNILKEKLGGKTWELGEGAFERLQDLPRPKLDAVKDSIPKLQNLPTPNLGVPAMSDWSGPALPTLSTGAVWLLLALLFLLSAWQALRWRRRAAQAAPERATLGPWPVQPEAVGTRRELIQAFDYLALWTLGLSAQSWNHQAVARRWGEQAPLHLESARSLASLYEQARYTDGVEELTGEERDLARRTLLQLKEAL